MRRKRVDTYFSLRGAESRAAELHVHDVALGKFVLWTTVIVIVLGNLLMSIVLIPFLIVLNRLFLDFLVVLLGVLMGILFHFLLSHVTHVDKSHHVAAALAVPFAAILNVLVMVSVANGLMSSLAVQNARQNPWLVALLFGVSFVIPYLVGVLNKFKW